MRGSQPNAATQTVPAEMPAILDFMRCQLGRLESAIIELGQRLEPVLGDQGPPNLPEVAAKREIKSPLGRSLQEMADQAKKLVSITEETVARLQV